MKKPNVDQFIRNVRRSIGKHGPEIMTGFGIGGMALAVVLAVKATPKALVLIEDKKFDEQKSELTVMETVSAAWKCYIPATLAFAASATSIIYANSLNARRYTALATAYKISETALSEYKEKVVETIGEKKEQVVREKVEQAKLEKNPVSNNEIIITGAGESLCYDTISGRYFKSDLNQLKKAENELNKKMLRDMYVSLNEFYDELDLDHTKIGDDLGWNLDNGLIELEYGSHIADDGTPCIVINYRVAPKYGFSRFC